MLRAIAEYSRNDRAEFIKAVQETQAEQQASDITRKRKRLAAAQKRAGELEKLICKIYEDNVLGKLPDARYAALDAQYAKEQESLSGEITELEKAIAGYEQSRKSAEKFIALVDKYENFDNLTTTMLNEFVEKILVHERDRKGSIETTQEVEIYFNFVGRYIPPHFGEMNLTPEELEALRKKEERKDKLHQAYLRRKANGTQKRYEDYVLVKLPAVPVPPLLMGKVFFLVVGSVQVLVYFNCDLHGQGLSVYVDGDFHLPFLRSDFLQRFLNGVGRRTTAGSVYASQENKSVRMVKFHSDA